MNCLIENAYISELSWNGLVRKGFSKEIDHLSLVDFFALQNFSGKIWSLEFTASSSKSLEGFRNGLRKGSTRKGIEKQI